MELSIIIPTYNREEILRECLLRLIRQTYPADRFEIVIGDDGSTDGTARMIEALPKTHRIVYLTQSKKGQCAARNMALKQAQGRIILFLDSDMLLPPHVLASHMQIHATHPNIIVQGLALPTTDLHHPEKGRQGFHFYGNIQWGYFITWNASIPKELVFRAGLFDEDLDMWNDVELGFRLRKLGIKQIRNPDASGYHYSPPFTLDQLERFKKKFYQMGWDGYLYYKKHPCLETKFASGNWWGNLAWNAIRGCMVSWVGKERILGWMNRFDPPTPRLRQANAKGSKALLGIMVSLAGKHWYMQGLSAAKKQLG